MANKILYAALIAGTLMICVFNIVFFGVLVLFAALVAIAIMREILIRETYREEAEEDADRMADEEYEALIESTEYHVHFDRYIVLGKGFK